MLSWLRAKSDLAHVLSYETETAQLWKIEDAADEWLRENSSDWRVPWEQQSAVQRVASRDPQYQRARANVARATMRVKRIALENGVGTNITSVPPAVVGGPLIPLNLFDAVLHDTSHGGIDRQWVVDALNKTKGAAAERVQSEFWKLVNPLQWVKDALVLVLRLPFLLIEATGFDVAKVEDHFLGKVFKFIELAVLVGVAFELGLGRNELLDVVKKILSKWVSV